MDRLQACYRLADKLGSNSKTLGLRCYANQKTEGEFVFILDGLVIIDYNPDSNKFKIRVDIFDSYKSNLLARLGLQRRIESLIGGVK